MRVRLAVLLLAGLLGLALAAPEKEREGGDADAVERGRALFHDTQEGSHASCAMCHSLLPEEREAKEAEHLGPGSTLFGSAVRAGWRNMNTYRDVGEASDRCAKWWQERKGGLRDTQQADVVAFLKTHAPEGPLPKREVERKTKLLSDLEGGDAEKGRRLLTRYCQGCHNGSDHALSFEFKPNRRKKDAVARKVRGYNAKGQFKPQEGTMSWFTTDRLADEDLRHILAYVGK